MKNLSLTGSDRVYDDFKKKVIEFRKTMPIIQALGNPDMKQTHWEKVFDVLKIEFKPDV